MKPLLLIDGHNTLCRSLFVFQSLATSDGRQLGGLYGFLNSLIRVAGIYSDHRVVVLWDGGRCPRRMALHPGYKDRPRKETEGEPIYNQVKMAREACEALGMHTFLFRKVEADDLIAVLSRKVKKSLIYSTDKDFLQLVRPGHKMLRPRNTGDVLIDHRSSDDLVGVESRILLALGGDNGDRVPGIPGVGGKTAENVIEIAKTRPETDSIFTFKSDLTGLKAVAQWALDTKLKGGPSRWKKILANWDSLEMSLGLVDLWREDLVTAEQSEEMDLELVRDVPFDSEKLQALFDDWEFMIDVSETENLVTGTPFNLEDSGFGIVSLTKKVAPVTNDDSFFMDLFDDEPEIEMEPKIKEPQIEMEPKIKEPRPSPTPVAVGIEDLLSEDPEPEDLFPEDLTPEPEPESETPKAWMFLLGAGYVEDSMVATVIISHQYGFDSVEEAMVDLGKGIRAYYEQKVEESQKFHRCPHCKKSLVEDPDIEEFQQYLLETIFFGTSNSVGYLTEEILQWDLWAPLTPETLATAIHIHQNAETLIAEAAYGDIHARKWENSVTLPDGIALFREP